MVKSSKPRQTRAKAAKRSQGSRSKPAAKSTRRARGAAASVDHERQIALNLVRLQADPGSAQLLAQAQLDIDQHGLDRFFSAVAMTPAGRRVVKEEAQHARLGAAQPRRRTAAASLIRRTAVEAKTPEAAQAFALPGIGLPA